MDRLSELLELVPPNFSILPYINAKSISLVLAVLYVIAKRNEFFSKLKEVDYINGPRVLFNPWTLCGAFLPSTRLTLSREFQWEFRNDLYKRFGTDVIAIVPYIGGKPNIWTSNLEFAKRIVSNGPQSTFHKTARFSKILKIFGLNLGATTDGEDWRRHRRLLGSVFNNSKLYDLTWDESIRLYKEMVQTEGWEQKGSFEVLAAQDFSNRFALANIVSCGYGVPVQWSAFKEREDGQMTVYKAMYMLSRSPFFLMLPKWMLNIPLKFFKNVKESFQALTSFFHEQIQQRKSEIKEELKFGRDSVTPREDILSRLVYSNEAPDEKYTLSEDEVIGNLYGLFTGGIENPGHSIALALGLLAVYQEEQQIVYEHIIDVIGKDRDPTHADYRSLYKILAVFYEVSRLIPSAQVLVRETREVTPLSMKMSDGKVETHVIPKGTSVFVDVVGLQFNPEYFENPNDFMPSRWYGEEESGLINMDKATMFGLGPRVCVGQRFTLTEALAFLTVFLRDWHVDIILKEGQRRDKWDSIFRAVMNTTYTTTPVSIKLTRRK